MPRRRHPRTRDHLRWLLVRLGDDPVVRNIPVEVANPNWPMADERQAFELPRALTDRPWGRMHLRYGSASKTWAGWDAFDA
jgi:hypothetical protein